MAADESNPTTLRVAAAGDIHCRDSNRDRVVEAFALLRGDVDLVLLAGDLTTHGEPEQARLMAEACAAAETPTFAVLGNHDHHAGRAEAVADELRAAGVCVLDRSSTVIELDETEIGIVGTKGFVGGFSGSHLPDFGEPLLREVYAETSREVEALDRGLAAVAHCPVRLVVLHYAPIAETLAGEPEGIYTMLGSSRLADPIREHEPDLVVHGHAHAGTFRGTIDEVPVHNVSVPVIDRDFWLFELPLIEHPPPPVH